ncbi:hypothetical protein BRC71_02470 [Halobacteriales archaeon QH_7_65_31]|nr:MAG: hypothetical protein BRC71_02470 [Halobacteriales archaeon QH_7_65_31]
MRYAIAALLLLCVVTAPFAAVATTPASADAALQDTAGELTLTVDDAGDGTVTTTLATTADGVAGYQANVTFDPSVVRAQSATGVDMNDPIVNVNNEQGWVFLTQSAANGTDAPTLAQITFETVGETGSETSLEFVREDTLVNDVESENVSVDYQTQSVAVTDGGAIGVDAATATGAGPDGDDGGPSGGLLSNTLLLGVAVGLGIAALLGAGILVGVRVSS